MAEERYVTTMAAEASCDSTDEDSDGALDDETCEAEECPADSCDDAKTSDHIAVTVDLENSEHTLSKTFLSVALGGRYMTRLNKRQFDTTSPKLLALASALSPCFLRVGGVCSMTLVFSHDGTHGTHVVPQHAQDGFEERFKVDFWKGKIGRMKSQRHILTAKAWDMMDDFLTNVGWEIVWDFSNLLYAKDGSWDPHNARLFLQHSAEKGIKIAGVQLSNEPNSQGHKYYGVGTTPEELAANYKKLKDLLQEFPMYRNTVIIGPEITRRGLNGFFQEFLQLSEKGLLDHASMHHYYANAKDVNLRHCLNVNLLEEFSAILEKAVRANTLHGHGIPLTLTETSSFSGGGHKHLSDRFAAGFLWLDKLGVSARAGVERVYRQSFYGASYGLVQRKTNEPLPDFYLSVLFKRLVEGPVFEVQSQPRNKKLRLYANRARTDSEYAYCEGCVVIYYVNVGLKDLHLTLTQFSQNKLHLFQLTHGFGGLRSRKVKLNGRPLVMTGSQLPPLEPKTHYGEILVPRTSFGFVVVHDAFEVGSCFGWMRRFFSGR